MSTIEEAIEDVASDGIVVVVERGPDFTPTPRLEAALAELAAALEDRDLVEVAGFDLEVMQVGVLSSPGGMDLGFKFPISICEGWTICGNCTKTVTKAPKIL
jgi:hypothetical protein